MPVVLKIKVGFNFFEDEKIIYNVEKRGEDLHVFYEYEQETALVSIFVLYSVTF